MRRSDVPTEDRAAGELEAPIETGSLTHARLLRIGVVVAAVAAGVAILVATQGPSGATITGTQQRSIGAGIQSLIGGIPQRGHLLGDLGAPVTLVYFGDLECPYCRQFTLGALPAIIRKWVRPGKLKIEYRSMETATREPIVFMSQQVAALAAGRQNKMWYFLELFYHEQGEEDSGYVTEPFLRRLGAQVPGLNLPQWMSDRNDPTLAAEVSSDEELTKKLHFPATPSLFFGKTGSEARKYEPTSLTDPEGFNQRIGALLEEGA